MEKSKQDTNLTTVKEQASFESEAEAEEPETHIEEAKDVVESEYSEWDANKFMKKVEEGTKEEVFAYIAREMAANERDIRETEEEERREMEALKLAKGNK